MMVIIKPDSSANYKEVVSVLDEMLINDVISYAVTDISEQEAAYVKSKHSH